MSEKRTILTGPVKLLWGSANASEAEITTEIGYTEDGLQINYNTTLTKHEVDEELMAVGGCITGAEISLSFQIASATLANFRLAYGLPADAYDDLTKTLTIDPTSDLDYVSLKAIGQAPGGGTRTYVFPLVAAHGQRGTSIRKGQKILIPVEFEVFKGEGAPGTITDVPATP